MSSTNRGADRRPADYYPTPRWCTHRLIEHVDLPGGRWLEPAAGFGHIIEGVDDLRDDVDWTAIELRAECRPTLAGLTDEVICPADFVGLQQPELFDEGLTDEPEAARLSHYDVVVTNPPFSLAMEFIERSLPLADWVVMFLRLNFLGSQARNAFFRQKMPNVYIIPDRPSFTEDGRTDSIEYAWYVWKPGDRARATAEIEVLPTTDVGERRR